jgi:periplasmic protein TonB
MHLKKNLKFNLEKKRNSLLFTGLACAMAFTLAAFEWTTFSPKHNMSTDLSIDHLDDEQIVAITLPKKAVTPPPPAQKPVLDEFEIDDKPEVDKADEPDLVFPDETDYSEEIHDIGTEDEIIEEEVIPHYLVEIKPEFIGGEAALMKFLASKIRIPEMAKHAGVNGRIYVEFIIDEEGNVTNIQLLNELGYGCDEVALKAFEQMPAWIPGIQQNRKVKVRMRQPIGFRTR